MLKEILETLNEKLNHEDIMSILDVDKESYFYKGKNRYKFINVGSTNNIYKNDSSEVIYSSKSLSDIASKLVKLNVVSHF